jgi:tetratricopeptide (TPR) repeat protein
MKRFLILPIILIAACAVHKVETAKTIYLQARQAQEQGEDLQAIAAWKAAAEQAGKEIENGSYLNTNRMIRASSYVELGEWDRAFEDLKEIQIDELREEESWIYPMHAILMGDYYAQQHMNSVAENFYQSILKKSSLKSTSIYLLALERHVNNSIEMIQQSAAKTQNPEKFKNKEYETLAKEIEKFVEETPQSSVPHYLFADIESKLGEGNLALEHFLAAVEMGLPTKDLNRSAQFEIATILTNYEVSPLLRSTILKRAQRWWPGEASGLLRAGESSTEWLLQQSFVHAPEDLKSSPENRVRYLAISDGTTLKILLWEKL